MARFHAILIDPISSLEEPEQFSDSLYEVKTWGRRVLTGGQLSRDAVVKIFEKRWVEIETLRKEPAV